MDTSSRRVRHEIVDGVALMVFSLCASLGLTAVIALALGMT